MKKYWFIGDVHGELHLLRNLLQAIRSYKPDHIVFMGDLIDRGPDSRGVLDEIMSLDMDCSCLAGNHEILMLNALQEAIYGNNPMELWYRNGGESTLVSFGLPGFFGYPAEIDQLYLDFLLSLPLNLEIDLVPGGPVLATHAGLAPDLTYREQLKYGTYADLHQAMSENPALRADAFLWAREEFFRMEASDWEPRLVVHGHTPVSKMRHICQGLPNLEEFHFIDSDLCLRRTGPEGKLVSVCVDSGAVISGRLTAFGIEAGERVQLRSLTATREDIFPRDLGGFEG